MATRQDNGNRRPVRNALLKWQLQQDQQRIKEKQYRLMRIAASSPLSSLAENSKLNHRLLARRPRPLHDNSPDEDALVALIKERENHREAKSSKDRMDHFKSACLEQSNAQVNTSLQIISDSSASKKLNPSGVFYTPVTPGELNNSSSKVRQDLTFSRIDASASGQVGGKSAATSRLDFFRCNGIDTPDRWRTIAMHSNQEGRKESVVKKSEEDDVLHAERWLEKTASGGDSDTLWNDLRYGKKSIRAWANQLLKQPASVADWPKHVEISFRNDEDGMVPSDLSQVSVSAPITTKRSDLKSSTGQTISEMLISMNQSDEVDRLNTNLLGSNDRSYDGTNGGDKKPVLLDEISANDAHFALFGLVFPQWSLIVVVCCLVVGTCGFFMADLLALAGFLSTRTRISRVQRNRMHERMSILQQKFQGFQLTILRIETDSRTALTDVSQYINKLRINRKKYDNMLAKEMQELHHSFLHVRNELAMQEQGSVHARLKEVKVEMIDDVKNSNITDGAAEVENEKLLKATSAEDSIQVKATQAIPESKSETIVSAKLSDDITTMIEASVATSVPLSHDSNEQARQDPPVIPVRDEKSSPPLLPVRVHGSGMKLETQSDVNEGSVEHWPERGSTLLPAPEESSIRRMDAAVSSTLEVAKPFYKLSGTSWNKTFFSVLISLAACLLVHAYNLNRRKRWFEDRQKRRNRRALRLAQRRARAIAANLENSDDSETEEVSLLPPFENDDTQRQALDFDNHSQ